MLTKKPAHLVTEENATGEICLNLWWFLNVGTGIVSRIAGRAYSLAGTDEQKLEFLKPLAVLDYYCAELLPLPDRYTLTINGKELIGATTWMTFNSDTELVFRELINKVEADLPSQTRWINGEPETYRFEIPAEVVMVVTCVHELADGRLVALTSS